ncbi:MAG: DUF1972 domain-containing protein [Flavobacteriaceae bacterium]|nr:DUF1972 domain-containing protein [Flavobacteriaceae bacterium]
MRIAILGTRGIPNHYGGFEQFAEYFSTFLQEKGHEVYVYSSSFHPYKGDSYKGVHIIHRKNPEKIVGTVGQFIYDLNCILDSRKRNFDVILQLGYTSSAIWHFFLPKKAVIITNMDGLEWKRSKYSKKVRTFLKAMEKLAISHSDFLIVDSIGIQNYLEITYKKKSEYIAYGASLFSSPDEKILSDYNLKPFSYHLLIARMEPENNIDVIIKGVLKSQKDKPLILIGNHADTHYGKYLHETYKNSDKIRFVGTIYNMNILNNLRYFSDLYFHGHSVGGTNPSLLEAMASNCLIVANDNIFNRSVLDGNAYYFSNADEICAITNNISKKNHLNLIEENRKKIRNEYSWEVINNKYLKFIEECLNS